MDTAKSESNAKRVALYGRVSTRDKGQDVENQLAELRRFAASQGWEIQAEYIDHETGKNPGRPQFRRLFAVAARRGVDVVLFWSLDRLTREAAFETLQHLNTLSSYGVGYRSFTEPYLDSCGVFKDAIIAILGTVAKQERLRISERVRAGLNRAKEKGVKIGRPRKVFDRDQVVRLRDEDGLSWPEIARRTGLGQGTVVRAYQARKKPATPFQKP
jgi:DNA invertase Pin-like site-specific DNA recombinase